MKCRRAVLLEYFGEDAAVHEPSYSCCDVCASSNTTRDQYNEIKAVIQAVHDLPNSGEKKVKRRLYTNCDLYVHNYIRTVCMYVVVMVRYRSYILTYITQIAQWIQGSADKTLQRLKGVSSESFGCGNQLTHSVEKWCRFVRQAWLLGFLKHSLAVGSAHNRMSSIIYAAYTVTDIGVKLMIEDEVQEILLPSEMIVGLKTQVKSNAEVLSESVTSKGKGSHILNVAKELFSDKKNS